MDKLFKADVAVIMVDVKKREITLYAIDPTPHRGGLRVIDPVAMRYAKSSPFGHIIEAATIWATNHSNEKNGY